MPTKQELEVALVNADKAGDTQAAQQIANAIKGNQFNGSPSFIGNVDAALTKRGEQFGKNIEPILSEMTSFNPLTSIPANFRAINRVGGLVSGGIGDVIGEGVMALGDVIIPESIQDRLKSLTGEIAKSKPVREAVKLGSQFQAEQPLIAQDLADIANMAGIIPIGKAGQIAAKGVSDLGNVIPQGTVKQKIGEKILAGSTDVDTAPFKLKPQNSLQKALDIGASKIQSDNLAQETIKQGFDPAVIAAVKGSSTQDKKIMSKMVTILEKGKQNAQFAINNRPSDLVGESLMKRFNVIRETNKKAGNLIDRVAKSLKGKAVDVQPSVNNFINNLEEIGVTFTDDLKPIFIGSDIEGAIGAENVISNIVKRMRDTKSPDAFDAHRLKRFIDEQVTYGKSADGLTGKSVGIIKSLRRDLDSKLDDTFPRYNKVNTAYAETIDALDSFQDVAGAKMNLTGENANKAVGTLMRRVMSNQQSRVRLLDAMDGIEGTAKKYGGKFNDDLLSQVLFVDELDKVFKPVARTSLQGQVGQAVDRAVAAQATGGVTAMVRGVGKVADKLNGINEDNALKSIRELLNK